MAQHRRFVLVTGLSGAGKTLALRIFEDLGYYCVDNLPAALFPTFAELIIRSDTQRPGAAVCVDARSGADFANLPAYIEQASTFGVKSDILFLDSSDKVLVQRYSESRRRHPSSPSGSIEEGIATERELLGPIRARADLILDTSAISAAEFRERLADTFVGANTRGALTVTVMSFGFKYGIPSEADMVLDLRFLPNPYYDAELRAKTGNDEDVRDFVLNNSLSEEFLRHVTSLLKFTIPHYVRERKSYFTLALGCTGGRHRSVAIAQEILRLLRDLKYDARLRHRDIHKDDSQKE